MRGVCGGDLGGVYEVGNTGLVCRFPRQPLMVWEGCRQNGKQEQLGLGGKRCRNQGLGWLCFFFKSTETDRECDGDEVTV